VPTTGDNPARVNDSTTSTATSGSGGAASGHPSALIARVALGVFLVLMAAQIVSAVADAPQAWRAAAVTRGPFTLATQVAGDDNAMNVWFRALLSVRALGGPEAVGVVVTPVDVGTDRVTRFARDVLAGKAAEGSYTWRLTDAEFDALVARSGAKPALPGSWVAPGPRDSSWVLYCDASGRRVAAVVVPTSRLPKVAVPAGVDR
jgi:hypothetical protein